VFPRPLVFVSGLTVGDYLLWNWSLEGNHVVLALVSGLTLVPLAVVCLLLLALTAARVIAHSTRTAGRLTGRAGRRRARLRAAGASRARAAGQPPTSTTTSSKKLAA
jgi:hypothetical protein